MTKPTVQPSELFRERMREIRLRLTWTQEDLAQQLTELGVPMHQTTVARYESGERKIDIDNALAISAALCQSPVNMLIPAAPTPALTIDAKGVHRRAAPSQPDVLVAPKLRAPWTKVREWIRGEQPLLPGDERWLVGMPAQEQDRRLATVKLVAEMVEDLKALLLEDVAGQLKKADRDDALQLIEAMHELLRRQHAALKREG